MNIFKRYSRLIKDCKANDRKAQEQLYKLFYGEMLRLCYRYLKSDLLAKEALNSGFLKVFQHIISFEPHKGELGGWIRTIMIRSCIDLSRKEARFREINLQAEEYSEDLPAPEILNKLYAEDLLNYIRKLPTATQLVFNLSVIDGYSHKEIGAQMNIGESTSRWHLSEAKKILRGLLEPQQLSQDQPTEKNKKTT
ncbi:putative RNA polymerase ECF-type sigma factor [Pedobacter sp. BAL39]|uniref:RNA polymerase sigma factor n=1 Tax=Pedobacter sp. BAL39 TaxID=391596 RepID=UPI0001559432|nr:sigma-70 family RNA polymerase sigma factor [Pedobacter sp. BAL39]EDM36064.1 putative RNA polymerase ECF-type sigma factor [Pedobacter sp. BAL39]